MVLAFVGGVLLPWWWLKRKHSKRLAAFNAQLAETLTLMAGGLSAGLSLPQAVDTVVREGHQPMAGELGRALIEQRLGIPIEETLENVAERMESEDFCLGRHGHPHPARGRRQPGRAAQHRFRDAPRS